MENQKQVILYHPALSKMKLLQDNFLRSVDKEDVIALLEASNVNGFQLIIDQGHTAIYKIL